MKIKVEDEEVDEDDEGRQEAEKNVAQSLAEER